jgi:hypothetical protein
MASDYQIHHTTFLSALFAARKSLVHLNPPHHLVHCNVPLVLHILHSATEEVPITLPTENSLIAAVFVIEKLLQRT